MKVVFYKGYVQYIVVANERRKTRKVLKNAASKRSDGGCASAWRGRFRQ